MSHSYPLKDAFERGAETVLCIQDELQGKIPEISGEVVMQIIRIMNTNPGVLHTETKELVRFAVQLYILGIDTVSKKHCLETTEGIITEIEDLRESPENATKLRVEALRNKLFPDMTASDIHVKISVGTDTIDKYFFNNGWSSRVSERLYEGLKVYAERKEQH